VKVFHNVDGYQTVMGVLLKAIHVRHKEHARSVCDALRYTAESVFKNCINSMQQFEPGPEGTHEQKIQFNDSVSRLRTLHNQTLQRIRDLTKPVELAPDESANPNDNNYIGHNKAKELGLAKCICPTDDNRDIMCPFHGR
jgi:hypothetical protein